MTAPGRVVLITGSSSGFGKAYAEALVARGDRVYATLRSPAPAAAPKGLRYLTMDVTNQADVDAGVATVLKEQGRIDVLVNNAGFGIAGALEDTTVEEMRTQLDTNLFGIHRMVRAVLPSMRAQRSGRIVNMSSLAGIVSVPFQALYCVSKFGVEAYTEALRMETKPFGIHVSMIEPGDFATSCTANRRWAAAARAGSAYESMCRVAVARMEKDEQSNKDISPVVKTLLRALDADKPRLRYPVATAIQRFLVALRPILPQPWFEAMIMDTYKIR